MTLKEQFKRVKENWFIVLLVLVLLFIPFFSGVNVSSFAKTAPQYMEEAIAAPGFRSGGVYYDEGDFAPEVTERKITKNAYLSSEIARGEFFATEKKLKAIVSASDSILLNENVNKHDSGWKTTYSGSYQLKVKASKYDAVVKQLKELGEIESFSENARDITGSYTNLEAELELEKERLARYQAMYQEVEDISEKIELSDRIFNQERRVKYLEDALENKDLQVEYSTINVNLREKSSEYANIALVKFSRLVRTIVNSFNSLLSLFFLALPWAVVLFVAWLVYKKFKK